MKEFDAALGHVATRMGLSPEEVKEKVKSCKGPNFVGTKVCSINFILQENNS